MSDLEFNNFDGGIGFRDLAEGFSETSEIRKEINRVIYVVILVLTISFGNKVYNEIIIPNFGLEIEQEHGKEKKETLSLDYEEIFEIMSLLFSIIGLIYALFKNKGKGNTSQKAIQELIRSIDNVERILNTTSQGFCMLKGGIDGEIIKVNQSLLDLLGYSEEEILGKKIVGFIVAKDIKKINCKNGKKLNYRVSLIGKNGDLIPVEVHGSVFNDTNGITTHAFALISDLREIILDISEREKLLITFSHDIRSPLNGIFGLLELLEKENLDKKQGEYLKEIIKKSRFLLRLVNNILDYGKIENGKRIVEKVPVDLLEIVYNIKENLDESIREKGLSFDIMVDPKIKSFKGDPTCLEQILSNLVGNAIKFTENGGIYVRCYLYKNQLIFEVKDSGIGISKENLTKIFSDYDQADSSITRKYGGTGLGLGIVNTLVELMGGKVFVESEVGKGSIFKISLPYVFDKDVDGKKELKESSISIFDTGRKIDVKVSDTRVLIIDDDDTSVLVEKAFLKKMGFGHKNIFVVDSGEKAIELINKGEMFDLIITDQEMKGKSGNGMEGTCMAILIRKIDNYVVIVSSSGYGELDHVNKVKRALMDGCITKPIKIDVFKNFILKFFTNL